MTWLRLLPASLVFVFALLPGAHSAIADDTYMMFAKQAPLKKGDTVLGWVQKGTLLRAERTQDGFIRTTIADNLLNRHGRDVIVTPPSSSSSTTSGWIDMSYLQPTVEIEPNAQVRSDLASIDRIIFTIINSYNGGDPVFFPMNIESRVNTFELANTFTSQQQHMNMMATLKFLLLKIDQPNELGKSSTHFAQELTQTLGTLYALAETEHKTRTLNDKEYIELISSEDSMRTNFMAAGVGGMSFGVVSGQPDVAWEGLRFTVRAALTETDESKRAKLLLETRTRARKIARTELFNHLNKINVLAETVWQHRTSEKPKSASNAFMVDLNQMAYFRVNENDKPCQHDRIMVWQNTDKTLHNCMVKLVITGNKDTKNVYQFIQEWAPGRPIIFELSLGYLSDDEMIGSMSCEEIKTVKASIDAEQYKEVFECAYDHSKRHKTWDAFQALSDLRVVAKTEPRSIGYQQRVDMWFDGYPLLKNVQIDVTIYNGEKSATGTVAQDAWKAGEATWLYINQTKEDYWTPKYAMILIKLKNEEKYENNVEYKYRVDF